MRQKAVILIIAAASVLAVAGFRYLNAEVTAMYARVMGSTGYQLAILRTIEIPPLKAVAAARATKPAATRAPIAWAPDLPPLHLARTYVESNPSRYNAHIQHAARATNVPAALIRAVISAESSFNPYALSATGAVGLMQLMPDTAKRYGVKNRLDPSQNILGGALYLRDLQLLFKNNMHLTIAAYNAGEGAVLKHGRRIPPYPETVAYVPKVLKFYRQYRLA